MKSKYHHIPSLSTALYMLSGHTGAHACTRNAKISRGHSVLYPRSSSLEPLEHLISHVHISLLSHSISLSVILSLSLPPSIKRTHSFIESDHLIPVSHIPLFLSFDKTHSQLVCPWAYLSVCCTPPFFSNTFHFYHKNLLLLFKDSQFTFLPY